MLISDWSSDVCSSDLLTSQVICREYLIYLDGFSSCLEVQGASIMLTYQHTQPHVDPVIKTRALSAISAVSSKEKLHTDGRDASSLEDDRRESWARSIGNGSLVDDCRSEEHTSALQSLMRN